MPEIKINNAINTRHIAISQPQEFTKLKQSYDTTIARIQKSDFANSPAAYGKELELLDLLLASAVKSKREDDIKWITQRQEELNAELEPKKSKAELPVAYYRPTFKGQKPLSDNTNGDVCTSEKLTKIFQGKQDEYSEQEIQAITRSCQNKDRTSYNEDSIGAVGVLVDTKLSGTMILDFLRTSYKYPQTEKKNVLTESAKDIADFIAAGEAPTPAMQLAEFLNAQKYELQNKEDLKPCILKMYKMGIPTYRIEMILSRLQVIDFPKDSETPTYKIDTDALNSVLTVKKTLESTRGNERLEKTTDKAEKARMEILARLSFSRLITQRIQEDMESLKNVKTLDQAKANPNLRRYIENADDIKSITDLKNLITSQLHQQRELQKTEEAQLQTVLEKGSENWQDDIISEIDIFEGGKLFVTDSHGIHYQDKQKTNAQIKSDYEEAVSDKEYEFLFDYIANYKKGDGSINPSYPRVTAALRRQGITYNLLFNYIDYCVYPNGEINRDFVPVVSTLKKAGAKSADIPVITEELDIYRTKTGKYNQQEMSLASKLVNKNMPADDIVRVLDLCKDEKGNTNETLSNIANYFSDYGKFGISSILENYTTENHNINESEASKLLKTLNSFSGPNRPRAAFVFVHMFHNSFCDVDKIQSIIELCKQDDIINENMTPIAVDLLLNGGINSDNTYKQVVDILKKFRNSDNTLNLELINRINSILDENPDITPKEISSLM